MRAILALMLLLLPACYDPLYGEPLDTAAEIETYAATAAGTQALLDAHCVGCHFDGGTAPDWSSTLETDVSSDAGTYIVAGEPESSLLVTRMLAQDGTSPMPPGGVLDDALTQPVVDWIAAGAPLTPEEE